MKYASHWRYIQKVRHIILGTGERGIAFHDLNQMTRTKIFKHDDLRELLTEWENRRWVQSFLVQGARGRAPTIWRATTLLRDEWSRIMSTDAVVMDPASVVESVEDGADLAGRQHQDASRSRTADPEEENPWIANLRLYDPQHR